MYDSFHIDLTAEDPETVVSTVTLPLRVTVESIKISLIIAFSFIILLCI